MKIQKLHLNAFGPFTDSSLDFSAGSNGLHIVFGPNEAGKSSALRAIHGLLYGIPTHTVDNFLHKNAALRIGGEIENTAGKTFHFLRRKGRKDTLLNPNNKKGGAFPDDALRPFLGSVDGETFERVYGIGHEALREGGQEMKSLKGLVGESLFAATVGGTGLAELLSSLDEEASRIYNSRKRNATLNVGKKRHAELRKLQREKQLPKSRWEKIQKALTAAKTERDAVLKKQAELARELSGLERIQNAANLIATRKRIQHSRTELREARVLPSAYSMSDRNELQAELNALDREIDRLNESLDGEDSLRKKIRRIDIPANLIEQTDSILELKEQRAVTLKAADDRLLLQRDCETLRIEVGQILRDLGLNPEFDDTDQFRLTLDQRLLIQNLASDEKRLRNRPLEIEREKRATAEELDSIRDQLKRLGEAKDTDELEKIVAQIRRRGDLQDELNTISETLSAQLKTARRHLSQLGLWDGPLEDVLQLQTPLPETVDRFLNDFSALSQDESLNQQNSEQSQDELERIQQEIDALQLAGQVPTERELTDLRATRDKHWDAIREHLANPAPADGLFAADDQPDVEQFESLLKQSDELSDRLRRETERVTQLADREARKQRITARITKLSDESSAIKQRADLLQADWVAQWKSTGISPLPPKEMRGWLSRLAEVRQVAEDIDEKQNHVESLETRIARSCEQLSAGLAAVTQQDVQKSAGGLGLLFAKAEGVIADEDKRDSTRVQLQADERRLSGELKKLQQEEQDAATEFNSWNVQWQDCMKLIGADESATAEQVNHRLSQFERLAEIGHKISLQEKRQRDIGRDSEKFVAQVEQLAPRFLSSSTQNQSATDAAEELHQLLVRARREKTELENLQSTLSKTEQQLSDATERREELIQELHRLCEMAGVNSIDELPRVEQQSDELAALQKRLDETEDQLLALAGQNSLEEFIEQAAQWDADDLNVRVGELRDAVEDLKAQRDEVVVKVNELSGELETCASGSADAAAADQESLGVLSKMQSEAAQYIRLRYAATILRERIERLRAENADPLLERASSLFARMTCGEYSGLQTDYENDAPIIVGVRNQTTERVKVEAMSDGTRDQLYLALRLGYVERQLIQKEPLPFIVDDILIHFDDQRSLATLEVLSELAQQTQVIFLTHHAHLVELASSHLTESETFVHQLDSRMRQPVIASAAITAKRPR